MLDCRQLTRTYSEGPQDLTVLDHLDLQVRAGERVSEMRGECERVAQGRGERKKKEVGERKRGGSGQERGRRSGYGT